MVHLLMDCRTNWILRALKRLPRTCTDNLIDSASRTFSPCRSEKQSEKASRLRMDRFFPLAYWIKYQYMK